MHIVRIPAERTYPLLLPPDDRFSDAFVGEVSGLFPVHGFPVVDGADRDALHNSLRTFIYGTPWCPGATAEHVAECGHAGPHPPHIVLTTGITALCLVGDDGWCSAHLGFHAGGEQR
jgi:hypothetical protein